MNELSPLPPLFKFLDLRGARLTLNSRRFRHAKPSDFNDSEELRIRSIFPEDTEAALVKLERGFTDVILQHLNDPPTCVPELAAMVALLQHIYRKQPDVAALVKANRNKRGIPIYDAEHLRRLADVFISDINAHMQDHRVLCVTTNIDSERMWVRYAENHAGIAIRIKPNVAKDSKFQLFRPVIYRDNRPSLYDDTIEFLKDSLFGNQRARMTAMVNKIAYAKTRDWEYENEYRLVIAVRPDEAPWETPPYDPEEVTELYSVWR